ncbi:MAG TPA: hypothetical protein V6C84_18870 [Coleofasciculaceae cyanobacterium]|jgi:hypothetical protein
MSSSDYIKNVNSIIELGLLPRDQRFTPITVTTTAQVADASVAIPVTALGQAIPSGASLKFGTVTVVTSAAAAIGATSLAVTATSGAIASGATATYPLLYVLQGGNNIDINQATQSVDTSSYGIGLAVDMAKVSAAFKTSVSGIVHKNDPCISAILLIAGGNGVDGDREVAFRITLGDGRQYSGAALIENLKLSAPVRDILKYSFDLSGVGATTSTEPS